MTQTIFHHEFANGMVLIAEPMLSLESAAFTLRVPAGTAREPAELGGLCGLTCEQALRGAGQRDNRKLVEDLDNLGLERGESVAEAHTSFSGATLSRNLGPALRIYADIVRRPHLPEDELESGRQAALQELRAVEDEPAQKVMLELKRRHFPDPWGRPSTGSLAGLEAVTNDHIRNFLEPHYQPRGAVLGVAGRIEWNSLCDLVGELFADWAPRSHETQAETEGGKCHDHLHHESNQTQIGVAYPSLPYRDPAYFQAWGAVGVLSGGMSSRLFTEVREKRGLCYSVYASHHTLRDRGSVFCYAGTSRERAQETLDVMLAELVRLADGIEQNELDRLKARIKSALIMQQESSSARSSAIARDWYHLGRVRTLDEVGRLVDELTCDSINEYLSQNPPRDFTIVTLGPEPLEVHVGVS